MKAKITRGRFFPIACALVFGLGSPAAAEEAFSVKPGLWGFETTIEMPFGVPPQTHQNEDCLTDGTLDPREFLNEAQECEIEKIAMSSTEMTWAMACQLGGETMTGKGSMKTDGDRIDGNVAMSMAVSGQKFAMTIRWKGQHRGSCPATS